MSDSLPQVKSQEGVVGNFYYFRSSSSCFFYHISYLPLSLLVSVPEVKWSKTEEEERMNFIFEDVDCESRNRRKSADQYLKMLYTSLG